MQEKAVEGLSRTKLRECKRMLGRESKEERKAECKQKRVDTRFFRPKREGVHRVHHNRTGSKWI